MRHCGSASMLILPLLAGLAGCATPPPPASAPTSYVALLPNADGTVGRVDVKQGGAEVRLDQAMQAATLGGGAASTFRIDESQLRKDFGAALEARPPVPSDFTLRFQVDGATLTAESDEAITRILASVRQHPSPEVLITGYADYRELAAWNKVDNPGALPIGEVLQLAPPGSTPSPPTYTVVAGDTLAGVAHKQGLQRVQALAQRLKAAGVADGAISTSVRLIEATGALPPISDSPTRRVDVVVR